MNHIRDGIAWQDKAACTGQPLAMFVPDGESIRGLVAARQWCEGCPVQKECLMWAIRHRVDGYWGGTNSYQRAQLLRVRTRAKCPLCTATQLALLDDSELCLACGTSWIRDVRVKPITATPLPADTA